MSAIDLVILGFLKRTPSSPYDMVQIIEPSALKKIIKIGSPTIYQNIKKLAKKEYLLGKKERVGEMPEKTIYSLTEKGEEYFIKLMGDFSSKPGPMFFNFNSFIKNLTLVDKETGLKMLRDLKLYFYDTKEDLDSDLNSIKSPSFEVKAILKQYTIMLKGMIAWVEEIIEDYKNE